MSQSDPHLLFTKKVRPFGIGGSDIAAILGLSPYKSAVELWSELVSRQAPPEIDKLHLRFGQFAESFVAKEYERETGLVTVSHPQAVYHKLHGFMFGHVDRFVVSDPREPAIVNGAVQTDRLLECKTASAFSRSGWGEAGTDMVPHAYLLQCAWYLAVTGCEYADLAALIGNSELRVYHIKRDPELETLLTLHAQRFWCDHVLAQRPPEPSSARDAAILFPRESTGTSAEATPEQMHHIGVYRRLAQEAQRLSDECEKIRSEIMGYMGAREKLTYRGRVVATWRCSRPSRRLDTKSLAQTHPEIASEFMQTVIGTRRFLIKDEPLEQVAPSGSHNEKLPISTTVPAELEETAPTEGQP